MSLTLLCQIFLPIIGLAGPLLILLGLPGTWLLLSLVGLAEWITEPRLFGTPVLVTAVARAVAGELLPSCARACAKPRRWPRRPGAAAASARDT